MFIYKTIIFNNFIYREKGNLKNKVDDDIYDFINKKILRNKSENEKIKLNDTSRKQSLPYLFPLNFKNQDINNKRL